MTDGEDLTKEEKSIQRRMDRLLRDMKKANLCIFVNDSTLEVYRGEVPHTGFAGAVDNTKSVMSFFDIEYCGIDGGATL